MLIDDICSHMLPFAAERRVTDVRIGLGYTAVMLDNGRCGLAHTFRNEAGGGCCAFRGAGSLLGSSASELLGWAAKSPDVISAAVALATVNALTDAPLDCGADGVDVVHVEAADEVGMIGLFGPMVEPLKKRCKALHIFERMPNPGRGVLPEEAEPEILPRCQVVIITATTLINRTLDKVLEYCKNAREIMLLGPSAPFVSEVLAPRGVTIIAGARVTDTAQTLQVISEGGGTMRLKPSLHMYGVRI